MKRNCLYTVNPWNRNIFATGGGQWKLSDATMKNVNDYYRNQTSYNNSESSNSGFNFKEGAGVAAQAAPREMYDTLDPLYHLANGRETKLGNTLGNTGVDVFKAGASSGNGYMMLAGAGLKIGGDLVNIGWGHSIENKDAVEKNIANLKNIHFTSNNLDALQKQYSSMAPMAMSLGKVRNGLFTHAGTKEANKLALNQNNAVSFANRSYENAVHNYSQDVLNSSLANYSAYGGPVGVPFMTGSLGIMQQDKYIDAINNRSNAISKVNTFNQAPSSFSPLGNAFADGGGIHIKPSHKGLFTEKANRAGMGVQAYASHVLANKEDYPSSTVKQANFAKNAAGWKHDVGGSLEAAFLDNFSNDPLGAVMQYNRGLEAIAAQREAEEAAVAQQAAYDDMQKRMLAAETERQGLQSMLDSQGLTIQALMDAQRQNNYADDWKERMGADINANGSLKEFIKLNEGFKSKAYTLNGEAHPTIGYGFYDVYPGTTKKVKMGDTITREEADKYLDVAIRQRANELSSKIPNWDRLSSSQKDALIDLAFNAGTNAVHFKKGSKLINALANMDLKAASKQLNTTSRNPAYNKALANRSARRKQLFMNGYNYKAFGGELGTNGTDFTNGLLEINTGGNHEENPYEGVQLGLDPQGIPNLVEEGETVYNDYVYSKRMKVPEFMKKQLGLSGSTKDEITFADASKKIAEASKERPNNPMDQEYLADALGKLAQVQEAERMRMQAEEANAEMEAMNEMNMAACGGKLNKYHDGGWKEGIQSLFNVDPKYAASRTEGFIPYNRTLTEEQVLAEENNPFFKEWTDYVNNNWDSQEVQDYLRALDAAAGGNHLFDAKGNLLDGAKDYFNKARTQNHLWGYYHLTPNIRHAIKGDDDYLDGNPSTWNNVGAVVGRPEFLPNGNVIFYHGAINGNGADASNMPYGYDANGAIPWAGLEGVATPTTPLSPMEQIAADKARQLGTEVRVTDNGTNFSVAPKAPTTIDRNGVVDRDVYEGGTGAGSNDVKPYPTWMRYAPAFGAGIMTLTDALGLTNRPDYTYANKLEAAAERAGYAPNVKFNPIGDYMTYRPLDRLFYANQLQANARATDRALANTSGGNRGTAQAAMLANGYNTNNSLGNLYRQAEEYNLAQRERVADFNRKTNMFNSQMGLEADSANARYRQMASHASLQGLAQAAAMRDSIDQRVGAARSANLTNLLNSLGNIGRENFALNQINWDRSNKYGARANGTSYYKKPNAHGGKINKRK